MAQAYIRETTLEIKDVLLKLFQGQTSPFKIKKGVVVKMESQRLKTYLKGTSCVKCGLKGSFFAVEKAKFCLVSKRCHLNLYGINSSGHEVMMTSDHIIPKSWEGSSNELWNRQPMCAPCNRKKGNLRKGV